MTYPISEIEGLTAFAASKLKSLGIRTTDRLLEAARTVKGRKALAAKTGISEQQLLEWANVSDYMRIPGMGKAKVGLVRAAGVTTVRELALRNPARLAAEHERREYQAQTRPRPAVGKVGRAVDRAGPQASAQNQLLTSRIGPARAGPRRRIGALPALTRHAADRAKRPHDRDHVQTRPAAAPADHPVLRALLSRPYPAVMGVLNVTPDSFSDGGQFIAPEQRTGAGPPHGRRGRRHHRHRRGIHPALWLGSRSRPKKN